MRLKIRMSQTRRLDACTGTSNMMRYSKGRGSTASPEVAPKFTTCLASAAVRARAWLASNVLSGAAAVGIPPAEQAIAISMPKAGTATALALRRKLMPSTVIGPAGRSS